MKRLLMQAILVSLAVLAPARADLLVGQTLRVAYLYPDTVTTYAGPTDVVGPAGTLSNFAGFVDLAFSDTNILITADRNAGINHVSFDGLEFVDLNGNIPNFTNVTVDGATNYAGFDSSRVSVAAHTIFVNVAALPGLQGQIISLDIGAPAAVPEPNSLILIGSVLLILFVASRRKAIAS